MEMNNVEVSHEVAIKAAFLLRLYCINHFHKVLGERGCTECIFSVGERQKRCILHSYLDGAAGEKGEAEINKNLERLQNGN